jgi:hypothetical protein
MIESPAGGFSRETATMCDVTQILGKIEAVEPLVVEQPPPSCV